MSVRTISLIQHNIARNHALSDSNIYFLLIVIANIINSNRTMCITIDGTTVNFYVSSVAIGIFRIISATPYIDSITNPCRATIIPEFRHCISCLSRGHTIDNAVVDSNLTHTSRNTTIDNATVDHQILLTRHINSFALFRSQRAAIYFKVHIASSIITTQHRIFSLNSTAINNQLAAICRTETVFIRCQLACFISTGIR